MLFLNFARQSQYASIFLQYMVHYNRWHFDYDLYVLLIGNLKIMKAFDEKM